MKVIQPVTITDSVLQSCSIPETDYPEWSSATAYVAGDYVMIAAAHKIYQALADNTNKPPADNASDWLDLGATNRWRMFDRKVGTVSSAATSISITLKPGIVSAIALVNIDAALVTVTMTDAADGVVFERTADTVDSSQIVDFYTYIFEDVRRKDTLIIDGLPAYRNAEITVTASSAEGSTVEIGALVPGKLHAFSVGTLSGASLGIVDYSKKEVDDYGNAYIVERAFSRKASWDYLIENRNIDLVQRVLASLRATPAVYIGSGRHASTVIYGFYRDFGMVIQYADYSECSIEIEGLT